MCADAATLRRNIKARGVAHRGDLVVPMTERQGRRHSAQWGDHLGRKTTSARARAGSEKRAGQAQAIRASSATVEYGRLAYSILGGGGAEDRG